MTGSTTAAPAAIAGRWAGAAATVGSLAAALITAFIVIRGATQLDEVVLRVVGAGVILFAAGVAIGSERMVAAATAPVLAGVVFAAGGDADLAWGRAVLVGCLWYVAVESALASIEQRDRTRRTPAVGIRRIREIATVVAIAAAVGIAGLAVASLAPERTLVIRALVAVAVLGALAGGLRRLDRG